MRVAAQSAVTMEADSKVVPTGAPHPSSHFCPLEALSPADIRTASLRAAHVHVIDLITRLLLLKGLTV